ncbi:MAG: hypothetical protein JWQ11_4304 [Rhizobacter sp.]|nr:hypothetical protein [Rhizobacter sp.]
MGLKTLVLTVLTALIALVAAVGSTAMAEEACAFNSQMNFLATPTTGY